MKLRPRIKAKWIAALRSGDYKQCRGQLRTRRNEFCCLGVLCNLHAQEHPEIAAKQERVEYYIGAEALPPVDVMTWAFKDYVSGWGSCSAKVEIPQLATNLAKLNDRGKTFKQIANLIEDYL
jgi:hypothetical protein